MSRTCCGPSLSRFDPMSSPTEIFAASIVPDAVEALTELGRPDEAEPRVDALELNGRRLDRPWMLAVGARCRATVLAARCDVGAAVRTAGCALTQHDRLAMPFERARTQLLLGRLIRRERSDATAALRDALAISSSSARRCGPTAPAPSSQVRRRARRPAQDGLTPA